MTEASRVNAAQVIWGNQDFQDARLRLLFLGKEESQDGQDDGLYTFCQGENLRILLMVSKSEASRRSREEFKSDWLKFGGEIYAEIKVYVSSSSSSSSNWGPPEALPDDGVVLSAMGSQGGQQSPPLPSSSAMKARPKSDTMTMRKTCNVRWFEDVANLELDEAALRKVKEVDADLLYIMESTIEVRQRHIERALSMQIGISVQDCASKPVVAIKSFEDNLGTDVKSIMGGLSRLSFLPNIQIPPRQLTERIKVVEPLIITSTYASYNDGSYITIQVENKHPTRSMVLRDIGFHMNNSVKSIDHEGISSPNRPSDKSSARSNSSVSAHDDPVGASPKVSGAAFPPISLPSFLNVSPAQILQPASRPPPRNVSFDNTPPREQKFPSSVGPNQVDSPLSPAIGLADLSRGLELLTPTNRGQNRFVPLNSLFRLYWVEKVRLPLYLKPGYKQSLVCRVEPYPTKPDLPDMYWQDEMPMRGPFWTPLTVAYTIHKPDVQNEQLFYTDKLVLWNASASLYQDFSIRIDVPPVILLNEVFILTLTIVNLSGSIKDLVVKVDKSSMNPQSMGRKSSFSVVTYDGPFSSKRGATPRSAKRMKTFMDLKRMAITDSTGDRSRSTSGENVFSRPMDDDDDEGEEGEDDDDEDEEEEDSAHKDLFPNAVLEPTSASGPGGQPQRGLAASVRGGATGVPSTSSRRDKADASSIVILNTTAPIGVLNCLDEGTLQLQVMAIRPGLARLSNLLLEDQISGQLYRLDRSLELFAHTRGLQLT